MSLDVNEVRGEYGPTTKSSARLILGCAGISATLYALAVIVTFCRLYLRLKIRLWFWDDWLALLGVVTMAVFIAGEHFTLRASTFPSLSSKACFYLTLTVNHT